MARGQIVDTPAQSLALLAKRSGGFAECTRQFRRQFAALGFAGNEARLGCARDIRRGIGLAQPAEGYARCQRVFGYGEHGQFIAFVKAVCDAVQQIAGQRLAFSA